MRQYIGARYVPQFFDNNGSTEWVEGLEYEALTIVTLLGNAFTSRKRVPASVGAPNLNPEYWVNTGNYNVGLDAVNARVDEVEDSLSDVETAVSGLSDDVSDINSNISDIDDNLSELNTETENLRTDVDGKFNQTNVIDFSSAMSYYVDGVGGDDTNDGSNEHPFRTADRAIQLLNTITSNAYIFFKTTGVYDISLGIFNCVTVHFEPLVEGVILNFTSRAVTIYNSHINFNSTKAYVLKVRHTFTGANPSPAVTIENCSAYAQKTIFECNLYFIGGYMWFTDCEFHDAYIESLKRRQRLEARGSICLLQNIKIVTELNDFTGNYCSFAMCPKIQMWGNNSFDADYDTVGGYLMFFNSCFTTLQTFFANTGNGKPNGLIFSDLGYLNYYLAKSQIESIQHTGAGINPATYHETRIDS